MSPTFNYTPIEQAAEILQLKTRTLYGLVEKNEIPHRRVGGVDRRTGKKKIIRFDRAELEQWSKPDEE